MNLGREEGSAPGPAVTLAPSVLPDHSSGLCCFLPGPGPGRWTPAVGGVNHSLLSALAALGMNRMAPPGSLLWSLQLGVASGSLPSSLNAH